jgi:hypothetical protein
MLWTLVSDHKCNRAVFDPIDCYRNQHRAEPARRWVQGIMLLDPSLEVHNFGSNALDSCVLKMYSANETSIECASRQPVFLKVDQKGILVLPNTLRLCGESNVSAITSDP